METISSVFTELLSSVGTFMTSIFTFEGENATALGVLVLVPAVAGIIGIVARTIRKSNP